MSGVALFIMNQYDVKRYAKIPHMSLAENKNTSHPAIMSTSFIMRWAGEKHILHHISVQFLEMETKTCHVTVSLPLNTLSFEVWTDCFFSAKGKPTRPTTTKTRTSVRGIQTEQLVCWVSIQLLRERQTCITSLWPQITRWSTVWNDHCQAIFKLTQQRSHWLMSWIFFVSAGLITQVLTTWR